MGDITSKGGRVHQWLATYVYGENDRLGERFLTGNERILVDFYPNKILL
jgi:hypothetical protein